MQYKKLLQVVSHRKRLFSPNTYAVKFLYICKSLFKEICLLLALCLIYPSPSLAIHKGAGNLVCGQCHTMHNQQGGMELDGASGGSLLLLQANVSSRAEIHNLCLQCHASNGGSQSTTIHGPQNVIAPKVYSSALWNSNNSFELIGSGGNFSTELGSGTDWVTDTPPALGYGHSLGATNVTPPGGDQMIAEFSCTSCHDPHGTSDPDSETINMFRNLRVDAIDAGANNSVRFRNYAHSVNRGRKTGSYVGSVSYGEQSRNGTDYYFGGDERDNASEVIWPVFTTRYGAITGNPETDGGKTNYYSGVRDTGIADWDYMSMSKWCGQCHDNWHEQTDKENKVLMMGPYTSWDWRHWRRHPVNTAMPRNAGPRPNGDGCAKGCHGSFLDRTNYTTALITQGKGLPVTAIGTNFYTNGPVYYLPNCAEAPGWLCDSYPNNTTMSDWPNQTAPRVFCLTCHFAHGGPYLDAMRWDYLYAVSPGNETGNPVPTTVGCQLCHNR